MRSERRSAQLFAQADVFGCERHLDALAQIARVEGAVALLLLAIGRMARAREGRRLVRLIALVAFQL
jgi:hypothetical protein